MSLLVDGAYLALTAAASPWWLFRSVTSARFRRSLADRLGRPPAQAKPAGRPRVWIHCASVGELNGARTFIDAVPKRFPDCDWVVSSFTETGREQARARYGADRVFLFPLDFSWTVRRTLRAVQPDVIVIVESEFWPNLLGQARVRRIPLLWVNGRLQEKALRRWRRWRWALGLDASPRNRYSIQTPAYAARFAELGVPPDAIRVTGNIKYDAVRTDVPEADRKRLRQAFGLAAEAPLIVGGSTWPGEEEALLAAYRELRASQPALRLLLAPRHIDRADDVERVIKEAGFACLRRSRAASAATPAEGDVAPVLLLDTMGELTTAYALAACAFVGKTLFVGGGHNVLEPAALGVPAVFGPLTAHCEEEAALVVERGAGRRVAGPAELTAALRDLLAHEDERRAMGARGRQAVRDNQGATERNLAALAELLPPGGKAP